MLGISSDTNVPVKVSDTAFSTRDMAFALFRRRWIILAIALPIMVLGGLSLFRQTGAYTATSQVVVELIKVDLPQWNTTGRNVDYDRELSTLLNIAMSVPVGKMAAAALQDSIPKMKELEPRLVDLNSTGALQRFLLNGFNVTVVGESSILELQFSSIHPRVSLIAVRALRDAFIEYQVHGRKNVAAIVYYDEQINTVRSEIDSLMSTRKLIMENSGYSSLTDEMRYETGQQADAENKLRKTIADKQALEVHYEEIKKCLLGDPREFPVGVDESKSQSLVYWRTVVGSHENALNITLSVHPEDSTPARQNLERLDRALERLRMEEVAYVESIRLALVTLQGTQEALQAQVTDLHLRNSKAPQIYQEISLLDIEINSLRRLLEDLQGKQGEVRLSQLADERVSSISVLTDPEIGVIISGGKTIIYFILIVVFGMTLGIVAALVLENMDHRVYGPKDVETRLNLPVYVSVARED